MKYIFEKYCWKIIISRDYGYYMLYIVKLENRNKVQVC